jgi:hypothetical protein
MEKSAEGKEEIPCRVTGMCGDGGQTGKKGTFPNFKKWPSFHPFSFGPLPD